MEKQQNYPLCYWIQTDCWSLENRIDWKQPVCGKRIDGYNPREIQGKCRIDDQINGIQSKMRSLPSKERHHGMSRYPDLRHEQAVCAVQPDRNFRRPMAEFALQGFDSGRISPRSILMECVSLTVAGQWWIYAIFPAIKDKLKSFFNCELSNASSVPIFDIYILYFNYRLLKIDAQKIWSYGCMSFKDKQSGKPLRGMNYILYYW